MTNSVSKTMKDNDAAVSTTTTSSGAVASITCATNQEDTNSSINKNSPNSKTPKRIKRKSDVVTEEERSETKRTTTLPENENITMHSLSGESPASRKARRGEFDTIDKLLTVAESLSSTSSCFIQSKQCWLLVKEVSSACISMCRDCCGVDTAVATTSDANDVGEKEVDESKTREEERMKEGQEEKEAEIAKDPDECRFVGWRRLRRRVLPSSSSSSSLATASTTASASNPEESDAPSTMFSTSLEVAGFLGPQDALDKDIKLWSIDVSDDDDTTTTSEWSAMSAKILSRVRNSFEHIMNFEVKMRAAYMKPDRVIWKRPIEHMREMCDQCRTTIFNGHFACLSCGFAVCLSCYELKIKESQSSLKNGNSYHQSPLTNWYYCVGHNKAGKLKRGGKKEHEPDELTFVQYILPEVLDTVYSTFKRRQTIPLKCDDSQNQNDSASKIDEKNNANTTTNMNAYLCLNASEHSDEALTDAFESRWHDRRPIVIRNVHTRLDQSIWSPQSFSADFGQLQVDLINCRNNRVLTGVALADFWVGFENEEMRLRDKKARPMILKLKDWPNSDDFKHMLPDRFDDLMNNMPVKEYLRRNAQQNLVSYLPDSFCLPDLGPKLYVAYSSADTPKDGTTNLHVDISDAVNLLIYAARIHDKPGGGDERMLALIEKCGCSADQVERFKKGHEIPGALWHIFKPQDADEIRTFLAKEELIKGKTMKQGTDPIHDQVNYIDDNMLRRLESEHRVEAFTIVQFLGDAVFIPSGAPHQVRNLNSCIKVALDFVSAQGIDQCLVITEQLRHLSEKHSNREDKLQVKNIVYHAVKRFLSSQPASSWPPKKNE